MKSPYSFETHGETFYSIDYVRYRAAQSWLYGWISGMIAGAICFALGIWVTS